MRVIVEVPKRSSDLKNRHILVEEEERLLETLKQLSERDWELHVIRIEQW